MSLACAAVSSPTALTRFSSKRAPALPNRARATARLSRCAAANIAFDAQEDVPATASRRNVLVLSTLVALPVALQAKAEGDYFTFYGAANPPATYGGVGGTTKDKARYSIVLPAYFKEDAVSKVDKGTSGIDSKFITGGRKKQTVFVITLRNEGSRDGTGFVLKDADTSLKTVAGSLFSLQDAIAAGSVASRPNPAGGFTYEITGGPECFATGITTSKDGRLFAIFVSAPGASWAADTDELIKIRDSFIVYDTTS